MFLMLPLAVIFIGVADLASTLDCSSFTPCPTLVLTGTRFYPHLRGIYTILDETCHGRVSYSHNKSKYFLFYSSLAPSWMVYNEYCHNYYSAILEGFDRSYTKVDYCLPNLFPYSQWTEYEYPKDHTNVDSAFSLTCKNASARPCEAVRISNLQYEYANEVQGVYMHLTQFNCSFQSRVYVQEKGSYYLYVGKTPSRKIGWVVSGVPCPEYDLIRIYTDDASEWPEQTTGWKEFTSSTEATWMAIDNIMSCTAMPTLITPISCEAGRLPCINQSKCIFPEWICDGVEDCLSGSDEMSCRTCGADKFQCLDYSNCIPYRQNCDGQQQCSDGSDEWDCFKIQLTGVKDAEVLYIHFTDFYYPFCVPLSGWNNALNNDLCGLMGFGSANKTDRLPSADSWAATFVTGSTTGINAMLASLSSSSTCASGQTLILVCNFDNCGSRGRQYALSPVASIVHGTDAREGSWPWQIFLRFRYNSSYGSVCGGSVIDPWWVLTDAHCVNRSSVPGYYYIYFGTILRWDPFALIIQAELLFPNPAYAGGMYADMALIKLRTPLNYTDLIRPVCLEDPSINYVYRECYITGFGTTGFRDDGSRKYFNILQESRIYILPATWCQNAYGFNNFDPNIVLCVGTKDNLTNACMGDSGGPLVCRTSNNVWVERGMPTTGFGGCDYASVFIRLSAFKSFIQGYVPSAYQANTTSTDTSMPYTTTTPTKTTPTTTTTTPTTTTPTTTTLATTYMQTTTTATTMSTTLATANATTTTSTTLSTTSVSPNTTTTTAVDTYTNDTNATTVKPTEFTIELGQLGIVNTTTTVSTSRATTTAISRYTYLIVLFSLQWIMQKGI